MDEDGVADPRAARPVQLREASGDSGNDLTQINPGAAKKGSRSLKQGKKKKAISLISGVIAQSRFGRHERLSKSDRISTRKRAEPDSVLRAFAFRVGLDKALLEARGRLTTSQVEAFFKDVERLLAIDAARFDNVPIGFAHLSHMHDAPEKSLKFELNWLAERMASSSARLNAFLASRSVIEQDLLNGQFDRASERLGDLEIREGVSLWSTSLRIAVAQELQGDEGQKQIAADIRKHYPKGILQFLARNWSQRAERSVPIGWFLDNATRRLGALAEGDVRTYLSYKLLSEWPKADKSVASILRTEQSHHVFDMYETWVSALQHFAISATSKAQRLLAAGALKRMQTINDFRLCKLAQSFGVPDWPHSAPVAPTGISDLLITGAAASAYRAVRSARNDEARSGFTVLTRSLILSSARQPRLPAHKSTDLESRIALALVAQADPLRFAADVDIDAARKLGHLYACIPAGTATRALHAALNASSATDHFSLLKLAILNFGHVSFMDVAINADQKDDVQKYLATIPAGKTRALANLFGKHAQSNEQDEIEPGAKAYALACAAHLAGNYDAVEAFIGPALQSQSVLLSNASTTLALSAYGANGNLAPAAALISTELAVKGRRPDSLPIRSALADLKWDDVKPFAADIAISNAFAALSDIEPTDKTRTIRTFALQKVLRTLGIDKPSKVRSIARKERTAEYAYFLYRACSTDVLDMIGPLKGSRAVLEERREIYSALVELNPALAEEYRYQVLTISKEIRIGQGRQTIDASRVHVDIGALKSILRRDLIDTYSRYAQLVRDEGPAESFDDVIRNISKPEVLVKQLLAASDRESDVLLILMMRQARDSYLFNIPHGLDSYLSKRVRHGSIVGHLRAPVEAEGMITQQHIDGTYKDNVKWGHVIATARDPEELIRAFNSFAKSLDQYLLRLKDVLLHVRSEERPIGMFDIKFAPLQYRLVRAVASRDPTIEMFLETVLATLRGLLNVSLQAAHTQIRTDASRDIGELFNQLRVAVYNSLPPGNDRADLIGALNNASANAQAAVKSAANWFVPTETEDVKFALDVVYEIALTSVRSFTPGFEPELTFKDDTGLQFTVQQMPVVQDVLYDVLSNVAKHSSMLSPRVSITASYNANQELLSFFVTNQIAEDRDIALLRAKLSDTRSKLRDPAYLARARTEGKSGIAKLASTVFQSEHGKLHFDVNDKCEFVLELALSVHRDQ